MSSQQQVAAVGQNVKALQAGIPFTANDGIPGPWMALVTRGGCGSCRTIEKLFLKLLAQVPSVHGYLHILTVGETTSGDQLGVICRALSVSAGQVLSAISRTERQASPVACDTVTASKHAKNARYLVHELSLAGVPMIITASGAGAVPTSIRELIAAFGATTSRDRGGVEHVEASADQPAPIQLAGSMRRLMPLAGQQPVGTLFAAWIGTSHIYFSASGGMIYAIDRATSRMTEVGRKGEGPGEFRFPITGRTINGDSIWIFDAMQRRITYLAPVNPATSRRQVIRTVGVPRFAGIAGLLDDGRFVNVPGAVSIRSEGPVGIRRDTVEVSLVDPKTGAESSLGRYPGREVAIYPNVVPGGEGFVASERVFGAELALAVGPDWIALGDTRHAEVVGLNPDGARLWQVTWTGATTNITKELVQELRQNRLNRAGSADRRQRLKMIFGVLPKAPAVGPRFSSDLIVDRLGRLWIPLDPIGASAQQTVLVWDPYADLILPVQMPRRLHVLDADATCVLVLAHSSSGEQSLGCLEPPAVFTILGAFADSPLAMRDKSSHSHFGHQIDGGIDA